jgi:hypothetical protein
MFHKKSVLAQKPVKRKKLSGAEVTSGLITTVKVIYIDSKVFPHPFCSELTATLAVQRLPDFNR